MAKIGDLVVDIVGDNSSLDAALKDSTKQTNTFASTAGKAFASLGASVAVFAGLVRGIEFNKAAEQAKVAFTVMTGSAKTAEKTLRELKDYANKTPLEFKDIRDATQTLIQFGLGAEEAVNTVKMLGDVSGGNAERLKSLAVAMGQISSSSRLNGQDLNQLINSGFNPLLEISNKTGRSMADLKEDMEDGAISADMVKESFKRATSEGGQFFGMLEKQADTATGKLSTMNDAIETSLGGLTEAFTPFIKGFADVVTTLLGAFSALPTGAQAFAGAVALIGAALLAAIPVVQLFGITLTASMGPIAMAVGAATALGIAISSAVNDDMLKRYDELAKKFGYIAEQTGLSGKELEKFVNNSKMVEQALAGSVMLDRKKIDDIAKAYGMTAEQVAKIGLASKAVSDRHNSLFGPIIGDAQRARAESNKIAEDAKKTSDLAKKTADEKKAQDAEEAVRSKTKADAAAAELAANKKIADEKKKALIEEINLSQMSEKERITASYNAQMAILGMDKDTASQRLAITEKYDADIAKLDEESASREKEINSESLEGHKTTEDGKVVVTKEKTKEQVAAEAQAEANKKALWEASVQAFTSIVSSISQIFRAGKEQEIADLQMAYDKDMELLENGGMTRKEKLQEDLKVAKETGDAEAIAKAELELKKFKSTEEFEKKKANLRYEADMASWQSSIVMALVDAARSVVSIMATSPWPMWPALMAISGATTTAQVAAIASNKPQPPKLWTGSTNPLQAGSYIVGDQGPEMVTLPQGSTVKNNRDTMSALGGNNQPMRATIQFMMDSVLVAEKTADIFNNGIVRLELA